MKRVSYLLLFIYLLSANCTGILGKKQEDKRKK